MSKPSVGDSRTLALLATAAMAALAASSLDVAAAAPARPPTDWRYSGGDPTFTRFRRSTRSTPPMFPG